MNDGQQPAQGTREQRTQPSQGHSQPQKTATIDLQTLKKASKHSTGWVGREYVTIQTKSKQHIPTERLPTNRDRCLAATKGVRSQRRPALFAAPLTAFCQNKTQVHVASAKKLTFLLRRNSIFIIQCPISIIQIKITNIAFE